MPHLQNQKNQSITKLINDLEILLRREASDQEMVKSSLASAGKALSDLEAIVSQQNTPISSWMEYKIYKASDALRSVRDALVADNLAD